MQALFLSAALTTDWVCGDNEPTAENLKQRIEKVIASGKFDLGIISPINRFSREQRTGIALILVDSPHPAMRRQAILILQSCAPDVAAETFRKLLDDSDPGNRVLAAAFLAEHTNNAKAETTILQTAASDDPNLALPAITALGKLKSAEATALLKKRIGAKATPDAVLAAAIAAAGNSQSADYTDALVKLLDRTELRSQRHMDNVRICDLAAAALERIHDIHHTGIKNAYSSGPIEVRDKGIAAWKAWARKRERSGAGEGRIGYIDSLLRDCSEELLIASADDRKRIAAKISVALGTTFCLGDSASTPQPIHGIITGLGPPTRNVA